MSNGEKEASGVCAAVRLVRASTKWNYFSHCRVKLQLWCWRWISHSFYTRTTENASARRHRAHIIIVITPHKHTMQFRLVVCGVRCVCVCRRSNAAPTREHDVFLLFSIIILSALLASVVFSLLSFRLSSLESCFFFSWKQNIGLAENHEIDSRLLLLSSTLVYSTGLLIIIHSLLLSFLGNGDWLADSVRIRRLEWRRGCGSSSIWMEFSVAGLGPFFIVRWVRSSCVASLSIKTEHHILWISFVVAAHDVCSFVLFTF